ncbi:MAG: COX15/CtaA family protein [Acidobacteria bacterium]|nr:COX15/CtaA family protein [Acidobacteriota bacterium]
MRLASLVTATAQLALGIATLLYVVPVPLAVFHQGWARVVLLAELRWCRHGARHA